MRDTSKDIAFIVDSGASIPPLLSKEMEDQGIIVERIPFYIRFGSQEFRDGVDISQAEFYTRMREYETQTKKLPETSQPTPADFNAVYKRVKETGVKGVIVLPVLKNYSGTHGSAALAAQEMKGIDIRVIDTQTTSGGTAFLLMEGLASIREHKNLDEVVGAIEQAKERSHIVLAVDNPKYLASRVAELVPGGKYIPLSVFNVPFKVALKIEEGKIKPLGSLSRSRRHALSLIYDELYRVVGDNPIIAYAVHADDQEVADEIVSVLKSRFSIMDNPYIPGGIYVTDLCPALGRYVGFNGAGIIAYEPRA